MSLLILLHFSIQSKKKSRWSKRETVEKLKKAWHKDRNSVRTERRIFLTLPSNNHVGHLTDEVSSIHFEFSQKFLFFTIKWYLKKKKKKKIEEKEHLLR